MAYANITITVTQEFVDYADNEFKKGSYSSRKNCDYLLLERYLVKHSQAVKEPTCWKHDCIIDATKIDFKHIMTKYFSMRKYEKVQQYRKSIDEGELDAFVYWTSDIPQRLLKAGDVVHAKIISKALPATEELDKIVDIGNGPFVDLRYRSDLDFN